MILNLYKFERDGIKLTFPTELDIEILNLPGITGICCSPKATTKYAKQVVMNKKVLYNLTIKQVRRIFNNYYGEDEFATIFGTW